MTIYDDDDDPEEYFFDLDETTFNEIVRLYFYGKPEQHINHYLEPIFDVADALAFTLVQLGAVIPDEEQRLRMLSRIWSEIAGNIIATIENTQSPKMDDEGESGSGSGGGGE